MYDWWVKLPQDVSQVPIMVASLAGAAALIAALIGAIVSFVVSRRALYIDAVTAERSRWIEALRGTVAKLSAEADRICALRRVAGYSDSDRWADDTRELHRLMSDLTLRLNPTEAEAKNLLRAARKLNSAARLHTAAAVILADEIMVRHAQWVLKAEWERVKQEAAGLVKAPMFLLRSWRRQRAYESFLQRDGSLAPLDEIGAGTGDVRLTLLRTKMDSY